MASLKILSEGMLFMGSGFPGFREAHNSRCLTSPIMREPLYLGVKSKNGSPVNDNYR